MMLQRLALSTRNQTSRHLGLLVLGSAVGTSTAPALCQEKKGIIDTVLPKDKDGNIEWGKSVSQVSESAFWDDLATAAGHKVRIWHCIHTVSDRLGRRFRFCLDSLKSFRHTNPSPIRISVRSKEPWILVYPLSYPTGSCLDTVRVLHSKEREKRLLQFSVRVRSMVYSGRKRTRFLQLSVRAISFLIRLFFFLVRTWFCRVTNAQLQRICEGRSCADPKGCRRFHGSK